MNSFPRLIFFIFLLVFALTSLRVASASEVSADEFFHAEREDLLELRDSLSSTSNLHSRWTGPPCYKDQSRWIGITCLNSHVVGINLQGIQLTGSLRPTALQNVAHLTNLTLSDNAIHGDLPTLKGLVYLRTVAFSGNRLSGSIPVEYATLPNLTRLELQDNLLNGTIPAFSQQNLSVFNVSYNFLQGRIPDTPALQRFSVSSYDHNLDLCGRPLDKPCPGPVPSPAVPVVPPPPLPSSPSSSSGAKGLELWGLILVTGSAVIVPVMIILCYFCYYKQCRRNVTTRKGENSGEGSSDFTVKKARGLGAGEGANKVDGLEFFDKSRPAFDLDDLLRSSAEVLGKGKLGTTYRTTLESGSVVAVKRLKEMGGVSRKEFVQQMQMLGTLKHENLVEIIAHYYSKDARLVVYEHVPDGSLMQLLHDNRGEGRVPLNWRARLTIAKGIARGLACLHHSLPSLRVPHANLKSSNILIHHSNHQYQPKLTDFGFLPLLHSPHQAQKLAIGRTPEFSQGKRLNHKADIYCLGLVLLEIISGQVPEEHEDLPAWVTSIIRNDWSTDILDLEIVSEKESYAEMLKLADIALQCTASETGRRPNISVAVERIEEINEENSGEGT